MSRGEPFRILLDLSVLSAANLSRGVGRYVGSLASALHARARQDPELVVSAIAERPLLREPRVTQDIPALLEELHEGKTRTAYTYLPWSRGGQRAVQSAIDQARAHVVHSLDPQVSPQGLSCPHIVTCHHLDSSADASQWHGVSATVERADRRRFFQADRIIASSRATAQELIARLNVSRGRISIVHHGVALATWNSGDLTAQAACREELGVQGRPYLLCVGGVQERKNVDGVMEGLRRARTMLGRRDLLLVWVGRLDRKERQRLEARARKFDVAEAVVSLGYVSDQVLAALYAGAVALVFASKREGFGYPVVEAMASGCPVVTSNGSSLIELAEGAALTLNPEDTQAIADSIVLLADDNSERRRLGQQGKERAKSFSLTRMVDGTLEAYRKATGPTALEGAADSRRLD